MATMAAAMKCLDFVIFNAAQVVSLDLAATPCSISQVHNLSPRFF